MLACVGDLVEDVVVHLHQPIQRASDTASVILRRRGGSAANVATAAAEVGVPSRFIGQVGDDATGDALVAALQQQGVEVVGRRGGRTGTIVALVEPHGERSMLSDRGAAVLLDEPDPTWLGQVTTLHVPFYSLCVEPLASTTVALVTWAHAADARVSVDLSSVALLEAYGIGHAVELVSSLRPHVVLANADEGHCVGARGLDRIGAQVTVVKQGADPALLYVDRAPAQAVPVPPLEDVRDTTGAGDAFAAGLLVALAGGADPVRAVDAGHRRAAEIITRLSGPEGVLRL